VLRRCCWLTIWLRFLFLVVCGKADCVCRARFAGWLCEGAASWVVGVSSDRHSMAVVWGRLGDGIGIEPTESWLLFVGLELLCE
jgi:hypothetical protein